MGDWVKYNSWMVTKEEKEIGIVLESELGPSGIWYSVHWPLSGVSWEEAFDIERVDEVSKR